MSEYVKTWQQTIGVVVDGAFGPKTLARSLEVAEAAGLTQQPEPRPEPDHPKPWELGQGSRRKLQGIELGLVRVVEGAVPLCKIQFIVLDGVRTLEQQKAIVARGASSTLNSRHLTGHAVDLGAWMDGAVSWHWPHYHLIAAAMKESARREGYPLTWGGDWKSFPDGPHFQRTWGK